MIFCRGCGKEIHETATACPHCGATQRGKFAAQVLVHPSAHFGAEGLLLGGFVQVHGVTSLQGYCSWF